MTTPNREFLLHKLRVANLHTQMVTNELSAICVALKGGMISDETAVEWACEVAGPYILGNMPYSEAAE